MDDVVNVFGADADADHVRGDARVLLLLVRQLLVGGAPGVDGEGLGVADAATRVSTCPRRSKAATYLARFEIISKPSTTSLPASAPPLTPKDSTPPKPRGRYFWARAWLAWLGRPG